MPDVLRGVAQVKGAQGTNLVYTVDFNTGECDCQHGQAWRWDNRRYVPGNLCNHKLKAIASVLSRQDEEDEELRNFYEMSVGKRHNAFVAVSAMHKELRRGDTEAALYWATVMIPHRGIVGVINYLRNIIFEETRDLALAQYIVKLSSHGKSVTRLDMNRAVARFCAAPKKWELPWRLDIFIDEMRGYQKLAKQYSYDVAKPSEIITEAEQGKLHRAMLKGFADGDRVAVQYGLKGLQKAKAKDVDKHRIMIFNTLVDVLNGSFPNKFEFDADYAHALHEIVLRRINGHGAPAYHELNALADALAGEPGLQSIATLSPAKHKLIVKSPKLYRIALGDLRKIPLYANDNHTWPGKALMKQYGATELQPGVPQKHIDFRYWGAYGGVAWRYLAFRQHTTIDCKWEDVSWRSPNWLWGHVEQMNY